jgi:Kef-type K+ transport system membrane component KefB/voltage-gated potassium channel Kch
MHELLRDIALCIGVAWILGVVAQFFRQPVLLAYLVGGFVIGPSCQRWIESVEAIETISELGLLFLMFMVGLEIDLKKIASAGKSITVTALCQIGGGFLLGLLIFKLLGFSLGTGQHWDALYLAVAAAMSSTVIIVKVLYDQRELDTLSGRITLGVLVLQDLFAILFLALQPSLNDLRASVLALSVARVVVLVAAALALSRYVLPTVFHRVARLPELVLVGAIAWCFGVAELAARLELSREMGALIAGVAISTFPYALDVAAKVTSLRDFFVTLFFVGLGLQMKVPGTTAVGLAAGVALFVVGSRLLTTFTPLYFMRFGLRQSLLPSIYLCQISEFSLVVLALGIQQKHVSESTQGGVALAFVLLALASTMAMTYSDGMVRRFVPALKRWGLTDLDSSPGTSGAAGHGHSHSARIIILGFFRTASSLLEELTHNAPDLLPEVAVVDFNPVAHASLKARGVRAIYGDLSQRDTLMHAGIPQAEIIVCTIPDSLLKGSTNEKLVRQLRALNPKAVIIAPAEVLTEIRTLKSAGADYVSIARFDEAAHLFKAIRAADGGMLAELATQLDERLQNRTEVLN